MSKSIESFGCVAMKSYRLTDLGYLLETLRIIFHITWILSILIILATVSWYYQLEPEYYLPIAYPSGAFGGLFLLFKIMDGRWDWSRKHWKEEL